MSDKYAETEQIEAVRQWLAENWKPLVAGLVVGLVVIFGWRGWQSHKAQHRATAASMYANLQQAVTGKKDADIHAIVKGLTSNYSNTPYASDAQFMLAQSDVSHARYKEAAQRLQWVVDHGDDAGTRSIARLRLAAVQWQLGNNKQALQTLAHPAPDFAGLYAALEGDIQRSAGHDKKARAAYQKALENLPADSVSRTGIQHKLADLSVSKVAKK